MIARPAGLKSIGRIVHNSDAIGMRVAFFRRMAGSNATALAYSPASVIFSLPDDIHAYICRERARLRCPQRE
jgi:hypothetical protein